MTDKRWKRHEREVAKIMGTHRIANSGFGQPDVVTETFSVEHKSTQRDPKWLFDALGQSKCNAREETIPIVVFSHYGKGRPIKRTCVMDFDDFMRLVNEYVRA